MAWSHLVVRCAMPQLSTVDLIPALIVEDMPAARDYLVRALRDLCGADADIATADSLAAARASLQAKPRAFVLVDIGLPDGSGVDLIGWLHEHQPDTVSMVVSAWGDEQTVLAALRAGSTGYLFKERDAFELRAALQTIQRGGAPIDPFVARHILALLTSGSASDVNAPLVSPEHALSEREAEILQLVSRGLSNREIAELTQLSRFTVESYTKAIYRKLAVRSRTAAVFAARAQGLLQ
jgi:DNA-binding NarL/FixJ family response regulator